MYKIKKRKEKEKEKKKSKMLKMKIVCYVKNGVIIGKLCAK